MIYVLLIFIAGALFFSGDISIFANSIDIPFKPGDVGLKTFEGADSTQGARTDGAVQINNALSEIVSWFRKILGALAAAWIIWQGFTLISAQGDEAVYENAQRSIIWGIIALVGSFLVDPFIRNVLYGGGDSISAGQAILNSELSTGRGILELSGLMFWIKTMLGVIAVAMIMYTGMRSIISLDSDDEISNQKRNVQWVVIGIMIIIFNEIFVNFGVYGNPTINPNTGKPETIRDSIRVITEVSGFVGFLLYFFAALAVAAIVYGGYLILTAAFNEEQAETGKNIIKNVLTGIVIAFLSYMLVRSVIFLQA
ncbi:hypothetical protein HON22_04715 [Candidatus Peregrinibacteria bacterium]|jgi:hypothetical protein|nr:hypothetical protein [Candidatus Peregrinibacteria bacterium]